VVNLATETHNFRIRQTKLTVLDASGLPKMPQSPSGLAKKQHLSMIIGTKTIYGQAPANGVRFFTGPMCVLSLRFRIADEIIRAYCNRPSEERSGVYTGRIGGYL
jgi:hypothetical protein